MPLFRWNILQQWKDYPGLVRWKCWGQQQPYIKFLFINAYQTRRLPVEENENHCRWVVREYKRYLLSWRNNLHCNRLVLICTILISSILPRCELTRLYHFLFLFSRRDKPNILWTSWKTLQLKVLVWFSRCGKTGSIRSKLCRYDWSSGLFKRKGICRYLFLIVLSLHWKN